MDPPPPLPALVGECVDLDFFGIIIMPEGRGRPSSSPSLGARDRFDDGDVESLSERGLVMVGGRG